MLWVAADDLRETGTTYATTTFETGPYPIIQQGVENWCTRHDLDSHVRAYQRYPERLVRRPRRHAETLKVNAVRR